MKTSQKQTSNRIPLLDFVPAQLKKGTKGVWRVEFYVLDPLNKTPSLKRHQRRVRPMANSRERERFAKRICFELNRKLERGWNPIIEQEAPKALALIKDVSRRYLLNIEKQVKDNSLREDSLRAYKSYLKNLERFLFERGEADVFCLKFDRILVGEFLDYIYYERNNSPRTYNNYLSFISMFSKYMILKGHLKANPADGFKKKPKGEKKRSLISRDDLVTIFNFLKTENHNYYTACYMVYSEFIRRTEMSKLLVSDINIKDRYIRIRAEISKNRKSQNVTILEEFLPILIAHISKANNSDFVFSGNNFKPGPEKCNPKAFSDIWSKYRKTQQWNPKYQFYSLKDTGITTLLESGVAALHVRDHARHHDISMTQQYVPSNTSVNSELLDGRLKM